MNIMGPLLLQNVKAGYYFADLTILHDKHKLVSSLSCILFSIICSTVEYYKANQSFCHVTISFTIKVIKLVEFLKQKKLHRF
jgi:hypothetical protein